MSHRSADELFYNWHDDESASITWHGQLLGEAFKVSIEGRNRWWLCTENARHSFYDFGSLAVYVRQITDDSPDGITYRHCRRPAPLLCARKVA